MLNRGLSKQDSEARVDRLRKKVKKAKAGREGEEGERELNDQLHPRTSHDREPSSNSTGSRIIRSEAGPSSSLVQLQRKGDVDDRGHINFWAEFESGVSCDSRRNRVAAA